MPVTVMSSSCQRGSRLLMVIMVMMILIMANDDVKNDNDKEVDTSEEKIELGTIMIMIITIIK